MLKIRQEQYKELGKVTFKQFEDEMVEHLKKYFHKYYEIHGEPLTRQVIQYGSERAAEYGFLTKRDTPLYIDLMLLLGSHFDKDPQYPWAKQILTDKVITDPIAKAVKLYNYAMKYLDEAAGEKHEYLGRAMIKAKEYPIEQFSLEQTENTESRFMAVFKELWTHKYNKLGGAVILRLAQLSKEKTQNHGMSSERGIILFGVLMFLLGSDFDEDIQYPWVTFILQDEAIRSPAGKVDGLYKAALDYLNKWIL